MPLNLFRKKNQAEQEKPNMTQQEESKQEIFSEDASQELQSGQEVSSNESELEIDHKVLEQNQQVETDEKKREIMEQSTKTYLKAMPLKELTDLENIKSEVEKGNIIILKVTPLAAKSIEDVKNAVNELFQFAESIKGDIARLGEERVVICPKTIRIWREKTPKPTSSDTVPTAA